MSTGTNPNPNPSPSPSPNPLWEASQAQEDAADAKREILRAKEQIDEVQRVMLVLQTTLHYSPSPYSKPAYTVSSRTNCKADIGWDCHCEMPTCIPP